MSFVCSGSELIVVLLSDLAGCCEAPVFLLGQLARERLPAGGRRSEVVERSERSSTEAAAARGDQQNLGPPSLADHQGAHRGE